MDSNKEYFLELEKELQKAYELAAHARKLGLDPCEEVEIKIASDLAERVEGLVGPKGIAKEIKKLEEQGKARDVIAKEIVQKICKGEIFKANAEVLIEQAVRTGVCIITEGVLVAPTEGIASVKIHSPTISPDDGNPDGSSYLAIYFAGPIRSAGGTASAQAVLLADYARRFFNIGRYRPTETEIERYVEECNIYNERCARLQYKPTDEELKFIVRNCPVCVSGEPTEQVEVSLYRDLKRVKTNRVRGGAILVLCEGIAQKAAKLLKYSSKMGLEDDWNFLTTLAKGIKKEEKKFELKEDNKFLEEIVAGRPIFSFSMAKGGFRLRYGRTRCSGIAAKAIHPATMYILNSFLAIGTQIKIDRPGKGAVVSVCENIMGPIVKLKDGSVVYVNDVKQAQELLNDIDEILFLGDLLISYGDFLKANHSLLPSAFVEEWWEKIAQAKQIKYSSSLSALGAFELSLKYSIPLHPKFTFFWNELNSAQLKELALWLFEHAKLEFDLFGLKSLSIEASKEKRYLELIGLPHQVKENKIFIDKENALALLLSLGLYKSGKRNLSFERFEKFFDENKNIFENLQQISSVNILNKAPVYIGVRMGRPEKAKKRQMSPPVHVLFPLGLTHKSREVLKLYSKLKSDPKKLEKGIYVELANYVCVDCKKKNYRPFCIYCGGKCILEKSNSKTKEVFSSPKFLDIVKEVETTKARLNGLALKEIKGVHGLISQYKIPEILDKGFLRAKYDLTIFRDGTCRFDMTNMPLTQFKPSEIGTSIKKLQELGYKNDIYGKSLRSADQLLAIEVQDIIIPYSAAEYFFRVSKFIDDLLVEVYQLKPYYQLNSYEDLIGHLCLALSPHTSAAVLCRIIGFTKANVCFAHPYFHCAKRRNCDGDEDSLMLLLDALLNFSVKFLPSSRGGTMDAPLVLSTKINPVEIDDEVHCMECVSSYSLEFYEKTLQFAQPSEIELKTVKDLLGKPEQYQSLAFTFDVSNIAAGPLKTSYTSLEKKMEKKVEVQFALEDKIRAVNSATVAKRVVLSHFLPDIYGNLRSFSRQEFRCSDCNKKYRRVPLKGKCVFCNGKLLPTIYKAGIEKYLEPTEKLIERYMLADYLKQRIELIKKDISSVFIDEKEKKKVNLSDFM
ncbi:MAG: DNA polymerase II large subunit [Candidatus Micrarchaeota archaeon]|nr:DNA polymerase II large subunit [Candidatus Micrarchaeota archaeon]